MNADSAVDVLPITVALARVIADPAMDAGKGIVADQRLPSVAELARLRERQPRLNVLSRRTGIVARWKQVDIDRTARPCRAGALFPSEIHDRGHVPGLLQHLHPLPTCFDVHVSMNRTVRSRASLL